MLKYLLEKEFKQILRNKLLSRLLIAMPVMTVVIFPFITSQEVRDVKLCIVDHDHSTASERLIAKAAASESFILTDACSGYQKAIESVEKGRSDIILEIPRGFERSLGRGEEVHIMIAANSVNGTRGSLGTQYLSSVIEDFSNELRRETGLTPKSSASMPAVNVTTNYRFNPTLDFRTFMVPALIAILLTQLGCALTALNIVGEKEKGTIEQINVTPVSKSLFILAKLIPNWCIGFAMAAIGILLAYLVHGLSPAGNLLTFIPFVAAYVFGITGLGLVISNYSETIQQAMFLVFLFLMLFLMTGGMFTPVESMPEWAQKLTAINPLQYFTEVMRLIYLKGSKFSDMLPQFYTLCAFALGFNTWAIAAYKKKQ